MLPLRRRHLHTEDEITQSSGGDVLQLQHLRPSMRSFSCCGDCKLTFLERRPMDLHK
jgi:hypothetical protein